MCAAHGNAFETIRTRRCVICTSRHYVPRERTQTEEEKDVQQETADADG
jgi:hypothetical protein